MEPQDSTDEVWQARREAALAALASLVRSGDPLRAEELFDPRRTNALAKPSHGANWQVLFLDGLVSKGAIDRRVANSVAYYRARNRYFINTLIEDMKSSDGRLRELAGGPQAQGPEPVAEEPAPLSSRPFEQLIRPLAPPPPPPRPPPPEPEEEEDPAPEEAEPEEAAPASPVFPPHVRPKRIDAAAVYDLLETVNMRLEASTDLQVQMGLTLAFVKDEVIYVRDRQSALSKRMKALEEAVASVPSAPAGEVSAELRDGMIALAEGVSAVGSSVNSMREEVLGAMQTTAGRVEAEKLSRVAEAIGSLSGQLSALRDLAAESEDE